MLFHTVEDPKEPLTEAGEKSFCFERLPFLINSYLKEPHKEAQSGVDLDIPAKVTN